MIDEEKKKINDFCTDLVEKLRQIFSDQYEIYKIKFQGIENKYKYDTMLNSILSLCLIQNLQNQGFTKNECISMFYQCINQYNMKKNNEKG